MVAAFAAARSSVRSQLQRRRSSPCARVALSVEASTSATQRVRQDELGLRIVSATLEAARWFNTYGRQPQADDLIVPMLTFKPASPRKLQDALVGDPEVLGLRVRAGVRMNR